MNWLEAVAALRQGLRVRRKGWVHPIMLSDHMYLIWEHGAHTKYDIGLSWFEANDWEVVPEPKKVTYYKAYYRLSWGGEHIYETSWSTDKDDLIREEDTLIEIEEREFEVPVNTQAHSRSEGGKVGKDV